jgi:long-chain alkane monooxygenase
MNRGPLREWVEQTDVDGFDLGYVNTPGSLADLVDCVVPVLTARGAYQSAYTPGTLRLKLLGPRRPVVRQHRGAVPGGRSGSTIIDRPSTLPSSRSPLAAQPTRGR